MTKFTIEVLGSGGAVATPRALCGCRVCVEAAQQGPPFSRCGPSYFVHGPNILFDTPEEIRTQLVRSSIREINACFYSHWHPDHVAGRRVFETNYNYTEGLTASRTTPIYIPSRVADDFKERMAIWENLEFLQSRELIKLHVLAEGDSVQIGDVKVTPFPLAESYVYAFLLESSQGQRALLAPDELYGWTPPDTLGELDVAIIPIGLMEHDPFTGERRLPEGFLERIREMNFNQSLQVARSIPAKTVYFSHIEEPEGMSFVDYQRLEQKLASEGTPVRFAYDMQRIEV